MVLNEKLNAITTPLNYHRTYTETEYAGLIIKILFTLLFTLFTVSYAHLLVETVTTYDIMIYFINKYFFQNQ